MPEIHRINGEVRRLHGNDPIGAEAEYNRALTTAKEQNAKFWELRAGTSLARLWDD